MTSKFILKVLHRLFDRTKTITEDEESRHHEPTEFFGATACSLGMRGRSRVYSSSLTSIRDAVSGRNKPKTAPWVECPRPPVGSSDRKHSFIS
jgi:hypothetical protein